MIEDLYSNPYGLWRVYSGYEESDAEVGIFRGFVDEIALRMAYASSYHGLIFEAIDDEVHLAHPLVKDNTSVNIRFSSRIGTATLSPTERVRWFRELFKDRDVLIKDEVVGSTVTLVYHPSNTNEVRANALKKLTDEEKAVLGLE